MSKENEDCFSSGQNSLTLKPKADKSRKSYPQTTLEQIAAWAAKASSSVQALLSVLASSAILALLLLQALSSVQACSSVLASSAVLALWSLQALLLLRGLSSLQTLSSARQTLSPVQALLDKRTLRRSGLPIVVEGEDIDAFGDTGSCHNIIDAEYARRLGLRIGGKALHLTQGDKTTLFSPGTVELQVAFPEDPMNPLTVVACVVKEFPFDILLGNGFLKKTKMLTTFFHRFKPCNFPRLRLKHSFYSTGSIIERFEVALADGKKVGALLDTGSSCNVIDSVWARKSGLRIRKGKKYRGWILLPSGEMKATIGQVHTTMALPGRKTVPLVLEVLKDCAASVVLGDEIIFNYNLYGERFSEAFFNNEEQDVLNELLHMGYEPWYMKVLRKAKERFRTSKSAEVRISTGPISETSEMERQGAWDRKYGYGKRASYDEWMQEYERRKRHEQACSQNIDIENKILILYTSDSMLQTLGEQPFDPYAATEV